MTLRSLVSGVDEPVAPFLAIQTLEVELSEPLPAITGESKPGLAPYASARVLVRLHRQPVGIIDIDLSHGSVSPAAVAQQIWTELGGAIASHLAADGVNVAGASSRPTLPIDATCSMRATRPDWRPMVSVVICTMSRPRQLQNALEALLQLDYPNFEIIVVDNAPDDVATANLVHERYSDVSMLRYEAESLRGLSAARNRGIDVARGEVLAFTDDDIVVDRDWLMSLVSGFDVEGTVACVTGLTLASELESPAQSLFEQYGSFNQGYESMLFSRDHNPAGTILYPYTAGVFGGGGNSAVRLDRFPGGLRFDRRLGPGSLAFGAEDLDIFLRAILGGKSIRYVPSAIAWHEHRRTYQDLRWQLFTYGAGFTALLTKWSFGNVRIAFDLLRFIPRALASRLRGGRPDETGSHRLPSELRRLEFLGYLYGPIAYLRSVLHFRRTVAVGKS